MVRSHSCPLSEKIKEYYQLDYSCFQTFILKSNTSDPISFHYHAWGRGEGVAQRRFRGWAPQHASDFIKALTFLLLILKGNILDLIFSKVVNNDTSQIQPGIFMIIFCFNVKSNEYDMKI